MAQVRGDKYPNSQEIMVSSIEDESTWPPEAPYFVVGIEGGTGGLNVHFTYAGLVELAETILATAVFARNRHKKKLEGGIEASLADWNP